MPAVMEEVARMSVADKMRLMVYLAKSVSFTMEQYDIVPPKRIKRRIGSMAGKWTLPTDEEDKAMDAEIESMFECLQEG